MNNSIQRLFELPIPWINIDILNLKNFDNIVDNYKLLWSFEPHKLYITIFLFLPTCLKE